jgi:hypothetical protein
MILPLPAWLAGHNVPTGSLLDQGWSNGLEVGFSEMCAIQ